MGDLQYQDSIKAGDHNILCALCLCPMIRPTMVLPCKHVFCAACLADAASAAVGKAGGAASATSQNPTEEQEQQQQQQEANRCAYPPTCPIDRTPIEAIKALQVGDVAEIGDSGGSVDIVATIDALEVECSNEAYGCTWKGTVVEYYGISVANTGGKGPDEPENATGHWASCGFRTLKCKIDGCTIKVSPVDAEGNKHENDEEAFYYHDQDTYVEHIRLLQEQLTRERDLSRQLTLQVSSLQEGLYALQNDTSDLRHRLEARHRHDMEQREAQGAVISRLLADVSMLTAKSFSGQSQQQHLHHGGSGGGRTSPIPTASSSSLLPSAPFSFEKRLLATSASRMVVRPFQEQAATTQAQLDVLVVHQGGGWCTVTTTAPLSAWRPDVTFEIVGFLPSMSSANDATHDEGGASGNENADGTVETPLVHSPAIPPEQPLSNDSVPLSPPPPQPPTIVPLSPSMMMVGVTSCRDTHLLTTTHLGNIPWSVALQGSGFIWDGNSGTCAAYVQPSRLDTPATAATAPNPSSPGQSAVDDNGGAPVGYSVKSRVGVHLSPMPDDTNKRQYQLEFSIDGMFVGTAAQNANEVPTTFSLDDGLLFPAVSLCCEGAAVRVVNQ